MPHYIFICEDCHKEFERVLHYDELEQELKQAEIRCPDCGSNHVEQKVAAFSAVTSKKS
jgi:putative FmdB family regulatory protein